jgi:hypothetical protein
MVHIAIRCHPSVPVHAGDLEEWLDAQLDRRRVQIPGATVRMSRLTQQLPSGDMHLGWLIEVDLPDEHGPRAKRVMNEALTDMRLLGFHPTMLAPAGDDVGLEVAVSANGRAR